METEVYHADYQSATDCIATVRRYGAILVRNFVPPAEQVSISDEILAHRLEAVDRSAAAVPEQFQAVEWEYPAAPPHILALGRRIGGLVERAIPEWQINQARAQLYSPGEAGIGWHRDYKRDTRLIALASFLGEAIFDIRLNDRIRHWRLRPGDLVMMRGTLLNGRLDDRPPHRVAAPRQGQRLSLAFRQVAAQVPALEAPND